MEFTLATTWPVTVLATVFVAVCILMMLIILIQKPRGGGLSAAFGGGGGSAQSAFGAKTGDFLTWFTVAMFICFVLLAMGMQWAINAERAPVEAAAQSQLDGPNLNPPATAETRPETESDLTSAENTVGSPDPDTTSSPTLTDSAPEPGTAP